MNDPTGDILLIYPIVGNLYRSWSGSKSSSLSLYNYALIDAFLLDDNLMLLTDQSLFSDFYFFPELCDSPRLDTFLVLEIGLLEITVDCRFLFCVPADDFEDFIILLYLAAIYFLNSSVFL